jgi:hypothetical protein
MNTDRLIDMLSAELDVVNSGRLTKTLLLALITGGAIAFVLMLLTVGPRPDLQASAHIEWVAVKLLFALSVVCIGALLLNRVMRPGLENATNWLLILFPFFAALAVALSVLLAQPQSWSELLRGATRVSSVRCLLLIVFFSTIPLAGVIYALRQGAPTRLKLCGAIAGIVAGGIGAAAYAFNCTSDTIPFIAIWYSAAIVICAIIGAEVGPRVLRW